MTTETGTGRAGLSKAGGPSHPRILATKLEPPPMRSEWVERPLLVSRLIEGQRKRLTLVSAPAGFGKTSLAVQWLGSQPGESAWLSLDQHDDQLDIFVAYFLHAVRRVIPDFALDVGSFLSSHTVPPPEFLADAVVAALNNVQKPVLVVLDDYHRIHSQEVHYYVKRLLEWAPENLHLAVLTRVDPPWPVARWRVSAGVSEFRATDLRFTLEDTCAFLRRADSTLTPESVRKVHERCEGWIASLQLLRLASGRDLGAGKTVGDHTGEVLVLDYLMEEVVTQEPAEIQEFLFVSSLLERFCAPLCDRLLNDGKRAVGSRQLISRLERENQFLVRLDKEGQWFRYHHLFHGLLAQQFRMEESPKRVARLHCLAGEWFAEQDLIEEALRHLIAAGEFDRAAAVLEGNMHQSIDGDQSRRELSRWLDLFPAEEERRRPSLLVARAYAAMARWEMHIAAPLLDGAEELLEDRSGGPPDKRLRSLRGDIAVLRAMCRFWGGDGQEAVQQGLRAWKLVPRRHRYARNIAGCYTAGGYTLIGRRDVALEFLADALADEFVEGNRHSGPLSYTRAVVYCLAGELTDMVTHARHVLALDESMGGSKYWSSFAHHMIAMAEYERNHLDAAAEHLSLIQAMRDHATPRIYHDCLVAQTVIALARGATESARAGATAARAFATEVHDAYSMAASDSLEARLDLVLGGRRSAPPSLVNGIHSNRWYFELPPLTLAEYWLADGTPKGLRAALEGIDEGLQNAERHHNVYQTIQFLVVKALALWKSGQREDALDTLGEALALAKPRGFVRTFVDRGDGMLPLLQEFYEQRTGDDYLLGLFDAFAGKVPPAAEASAGPLSNRESDVLHFLANRLSNKEIAQHLFVSSDTVKKHTISIYRKLGVNDRRQAVAVASQRGLIQPALFHGTSKA